MNTRHSKREAPNGEGKRGVEEVAKKQVANGC
jgi:hypothetical protein